MLLEDLRRQTKDIIFSHHEFEIPIFFTMLDSCLKDVNKEELLQLPLTVVQEDALSKSLDYFTKFALTQDKCWLLNIADQVNIFISSSKNLDRHLSSNEYYVLLSFTKVVLGVLASES